MRESRYPIRVFSDGGDVVTIYLCGVQLLPAAPRGTPAISSPAPAEGRYETADGALLTMKDPLPNGKRMWLNEATGEGFVER